jgi:predicted nucleic acid-binding protein
MGYLVDSNVLIDYVAERFTTEQLSRLDVIFDHELNISVISKIEILVFNSHIQETNAMLEFLKIANIIQLNDEIVDQTIAIRKKIKLKIPDAIIGATALVNQSILITHNITDFKKIDGITLYDPYQ